MPQTTCRRCRRASRVHAAPAREQEQSSRFIAAAAGSSPAAGHLVYVIKVVWPLAVAAGQRIRVAGIHGHYSPKLHLHANCSLRLVQPSPQAANQGRRGHAIGKLTAGIVSGVLQVPPQVSPPVPRRYRALLGKIAVDASHVEVIKCRQPEPSTCS